MLSVEILLSQIDAIECICFLSPRALYSLIRARTHAGTDRGEEWHPSPSRPCATWQGEQEQAGSERGKVGRRRQGP